MTNNVTPEPPSSWSQEICELYDPVRSLGVGGFGSVWLAREKNSCKKNSDDTSSIDDQGQEESPMNDRYLVAIKVVGHSHDQKISKQLQRSEEGYFHREISVLQEISHPRIVRCLNAIEDSCPTSTSAPYFIILEHCRGPTVESLINYGGAFGIYMAQEVASQLIDAISFLHGRAVIHRDIKPNNIIVTGATRADEACWSDDIEGCDAAKSNRWNIKLIDFGFARALGPEDIIDRKSLEKKKEPRNEFFGRSSVDSQLDDRSIHKSSFGLDLSSSGKQQEDLSNSLSRYKVRGLSAVGNRNFAAPEIKKGIRASRRFSKKKVEDAEQPAAQEPLSDYVSDYGMIVDAFSTGATIRYMVTGVPPHTSVDEFVQEKNSAINVLGRKIKKAVNKKYATKRKKRYRSNQDLPSQVVRLILGLTHWNEKKRTTIRSARDYEWVASSYSMKNAKDDDVSRITGGKLDFLKCATEKV